MAEEPAFPEDVPVGARAAQEQETAAPAEQAAERKRKRQLMGVAAGIGSAAIVAALLYANRGRKNEGNS